MRTPSQRLLLEASRRRFTAGKTPKDALARTRQLPFGTIPIFNHLGEHLDSLSQVHEELHAYRLLLENIPRRLPVPKQKEEPPAYRISVKPTQLGFALPFRAQTMFLMNTASLLADAEIRGNVALEVDAEGASTVDPAIAFARIVREKLTAYAPPRIAVAARRARSIRDIETLNAEGIPVRLVKGAYADGDTVQTDAEILTRFQECARILLANGTQPAFATHDMTLIRWVRREAQECNRTPNEIEFQFLLGLRPHTQISLLCKGYRVALYLPYGTAWKEYALRRWDFFRRLRRDPWKFFTYLYW